MVLRAIGFSTKHALGHGKVLIRILHNAMGISGGASGSKFVFGLEHPSSAARARPFPPDSLASPPSLPPDHPVDVASPTPQVEKSWLTAKLDFAPPVVGSP